MLEQLPQKPTESLQVRGTELAARRREEFGDPVRPRVDTLRLKGR